jgi:DNA repair exonuclease SbcCD ATPase subunit
MESQELAELEVQAKQEIKSRQNFLDACAKARALKAEAAGLEKLIKELKAKLESIAHIDQQLADKKKELETVNVQLASQRKKQAAESEEHRKELKKIVVAYNELRASIGGDDTVKSWEAVESQVAKALAE